MERTAIRSAGALLTATAGLAVWLQAKRRPRCDPRGVFDAPDHEFQSPMKGRTEAPMSPKNGKLVPRAALLVVVGLLRLTARRCPEPPESSVLGAQFVRPRHPEMSD